METSHRLTVPMAVLREARLRHVRILARLRAGWVALAGLLAFGAIDALLAPGPAWRMLLFAVAAGAAGFSARAVFRAHLSATSLDRMLARLVEEGRRDTDNAVVNALDFEERPGAAGDDPLSRALMVRQIEAAAERLREETGRETLRPPETARDRRILWILAGVLALTGLAAPRLAGAVLPRCLLPFLDLPPWCLTRFAVEPGNVKVDYGASVDVTVRTAGRRPRAIRLAVESRRPRETVELPLYESEPDTYRQTLEPVTEDLVYHARVPGGRSRTFSVTVDKTPRLDTVRVALDYPAYTRLPPVVRLLAPGGEIRAYPGTKATLLLTSNRELKGGRVTLGGKPVEVVKSEQPRTVEAVFTVGTAEVAFEAAVTGEDGKSCREAVTGRVAPLPDERPRIAAVNPPAESLATPRAKVPINLEATDDLGVRRVTLFRNVNGSEDFAKVLYEAPGRAAFVNVIETLDLADLGVRPGDVIDFYADVADSHPEPTQTESTPSCRLFIISEEQHAELARTMATTAALREKYEAFRRRWSELVEAQEKLRDEAAALKKELEAGAGGEAAKSRLAEQADRQAALAEQAREAAAQLESEAKAPAVLDVEKEYKDLLRDMARTMEKGAFHQEAAARALSGAGAAGANAKAGLEKALGQQEEALEDLKEGLEQYKEKIEKANEEIEELYALYADTEAFKALALRQKELVRRLHSYKDRALDAEAKGRVRELEAEQEAVREGLDAVKKRLREHAKPVREYAPKVADDAETIAKTIEELEIDGWMKKASAGLGKADVPPASAAAEEALDRMMSMMGQCDGGGQGAKGECEARLKMRMNGGLGKTFQQLAAGRGTGQGGGIGYAGAGADGAGATSGSMPFGLFGSSDLNGPKSPASTGMGRGEAEKTIAAVDPAAFAMGAEERTEKKGKEPAVELPANEPVMEEYRPLIMRYFKRAAEEP